MSENFWKRINNIVGILPIAALFGLIAFVAKIEIKDLDLWLHLAMGKYISLHKFVPNVDMLSATIAGKPWVNHEWLFQVITYNIFNAWGANGLIYMQVAVVTMTMFILLMIGYHRDRQLILAFLLFLVFLVYQQRFTIRPDIYSLLFFAVYIFVLALHIDKRWAAGFLFIIQVLWSNMHGFFFFGPLFVLIGIVSEWIKRHVPLPYEWSESGRLTDEEYSRIKRIFICVILACLVNPGTFAGAWYPIGVFFSLGGENQIFFKYIQELQPSVTWERAFEGGRFLFYKFLIFFSVITFIFNRRRIDISALLFWVVFFVFSTKALRSLPFFAFAAYLVIITNILYINPKELIPLRFEAGKFRYLTEIILKLLFAIWIFNYAQGVSVKSYYDFDGYKFKSEFGDVALQGYPDKAVDFLIENKVKGNFFNDFNSGAYMLGRVFPDIKVFIDGRTEVYGAAFFKEYLKIWEDGDKKTFDNAAERYNLTGALLNSSRLHIPSKLLQMVYANKEWVPVYFNYDAVIFLKDVQQNREVIDKYRVDLANWAPVHLDLFKLGPERVRPYRNYYRAYTLESLDLDEAALKEAQAALDAYPAYGEVYQVIGKIYAKKKEYLKAFENFRKALLFTPHDKETQYNLGLALIDLRRYEEAIKQYTTISRIWPKDAKAWFFMAKVHALDKKYDEVIPALEQAHQKDPQSYVDIINVGQTVFDQGEYDKALEVYGFAKQTNKHPDEIHFKLSEVYQKKELWEKAKQELQKALKIAPENADYKNALEALKARVP